jgi:hypothetical protein
MSSPFLKKIQPKKNSNTVYNIKKADYTTSDTLLLNKKQCAYSYRMQKLHYGQARLNSNTKEAPVPQCLPSPLLLPASGSAIQARIFFDIS